MQKLEHLTNTLGHATLTKVQLIPILYPHATIAEQGRIGILLEACIALWAALKSMRPPRYVAT